jgi:hypothetical protein
MMSRIKFNEKGKQREFINLVLQSINCPSLRELINRGVSVNYSTLKNYSTEQRLISESFFEELIELSSLDKNDFDIKAVSDNWGQVIGGKKSKRI